MTPPVRANLSAPEYVFPNPGVLDGVTGRTRVVMRMKNVAYGYEGVCVCVNVSVCRAIRFGLRAGFDLNIPAVKLF